MRTRGEFWWGGRVFAVLLGVLACACSSPTVQPPSSPVVSSPVLVQRTQRDLCDALSRFFGEQLDVRDTAIKPARDLATPLHGVGECHVELESDWVGYVSIVRVQDGESDRMNKSGLFRPIVDAPEPAWESGDRSVLTEVITHADGWRVTVRIAAERARTHTGQLVVTDEKISRAVRFVTGVARDFGHD